MYPFCWKNILKWNLLFITYVYSHSKFRYTNENRVELVVSYTIEYWLECFFGVNIVTILLSLSTFKHPNQCDHLKSKRLPLSTAIHSGTEHSNKKSAFFYFPATNPRSPNFLFYRLETRTGYKKKKNVDPSDNFSVFYARDENVPQSRVFDKPPCATQSWIAGGGDTAVAPAPVKQLTSVYRPFSF